MKIKTVLVSALMIVGVAMPSVAQNMDETELRNIRLEALKQRRIAMRQLAALHAQRRLGNACATRGNYGLATSQKYYSSHSGHPHYYTLP